MRPSSSKKSWAKSSDLEEEYSSEGWGRNVWDLAFQLLTRYQELGSEVPAIPNLHSQLDFWEQIQLTTLSASSICSPLHQRHLHSEETR